MNYGGRIALLTCSVVLLIVGVVCLRERLGPTHAPSAFLPGGDAGTPRDPGVNRPTVLMADPTTEMNHTAAQPWRDAEPIPLADLNLPLTPSDPTNGGIPANRTPALLEPPSSPATLQPDREWRNVLDRVPHSVERISPAPAPPLVAPQLVAPAPLPAVAIPPTDSTLDATTAATTNHAPVSRESPPRGASVLTVVNDSLWTIAERAYGSGLFYQALFALNRDRVLRPDRIAPGIEILTPPIAELRQRYPNLCPDVRN